MDGVDPNTALPSTSALARPSGKRLALRLRNDRVRPGHPIQEEALAQVSQHTVHRHRCRRQAAHAKRRHQSWPRLRPAHRPGTFEGSTMTIISTAPRPLFDGSLASSPAGRSELWAVKPGGQGDVTDYASRFEVQAHIGRYAYRHCWWTGYLYRIELLPASNPPPPGPRQTGFRAGRRLHRALPMAGSTSATSRAPPP